MVRNIARDLIEEAQDATDEQIAEVLAIVPETASEWARHHNYLNEFRARRLRAELREEAVTGARAPREAMERAAAAPPEPEPLFLRGIALEPDEEAALDRHIDGRIARALALWAAAVEAEQPGPVETRALRAAGALLHPHELGPLATFARGAVGASIAEFAGAAGAPNIGGRT